MRQPTREAYVYTIQVDGMIRYIGKGRGARPLTHAGDARRSAARCTKETAHLFPRLHRKLVEAVRVGSAIVERVIVSGLADAEAYRVESKLIAVFHRFHTGQLWNTIDERSMDPSTLPENWDDPENPLYKLPRPLPPRVGREICSIRKQEVGKPGNGLVLRRRRREFDRVRDPHQIKLWLLSQPQGVEQTQ